MLLRGEADKAHLQASGLAGGGAAGEKMVGGASGAWTDFRDVRGREASALELVAHDGAQVDERLAGTPCPRVISSACDLTREAIAKFGVNFETTLADRRTHRGLDVGRASAELNHRADAGVGDIRNDAAPSGVQGARDVAFRIDHQDRHAVGGEYSQHDAGLRSDDPIPRRPKCGRVASRGMNDVAMHLVEARDQLEVRHLTTKAIPVVIDGALVVADPVGKIHRGERAGADAANAPDESVADRGIGPRAQDFDARFGQ